MTEARSTRFLNDWHVSREECIGQQLLPLMDKQLRPDGSAEIYCLSSAIDDAVTSHAERTTDQIITKHAASWRVRVLPISNKIEMVSILLEWHEGPGIQVEKEIVQSGFSTDEAFRISSVTVTATVTGQLCKHHEDHLTR